jgi:digeranylgeranylglycerophospholipid reductase
MPKKIVIVGAGPIGCYTAQLLKRYGFDPLLLEDHSEVGRPLHCTGLVGSRVFSDKRPFMPPTSAILNEINGAVIRYNNQSFVIKRKGVAYVIDREKFDKGLSAGLNILYNNRFLGIEKYRNGYIIDTEKDQLFADIIIGADGSNSLVRNTINNNTNNISSYRGIQFRIKTALKDYDLVEVHLKDSFFFWIVPESSSVIRVGTISDNPYQNLQDFIKENKIKGEVLDKFGGLVSIGICKNTVKDNIALVGDAACQLKPLSYGGIYFGLRAADILADCIKRNRLNDYDALWKKELAFEIKIGLKAKELASRLNKKELDKVFKLLKEQKLLIEKMGDFENHSRFVLDMIKNPRIYPQLGNLIRIIFK